MNKISILLLSSLILLGGCTIPAEEEDFSTNFPPPTPVEEPEDDLAEEEPVVVGTVGGIVPSTDPTNRLRQIEEGRNDPFALPTPRVNIQRVTIPEAETGVNGAGTPSTPGDNGVAGGTGNGVAGGTGNGVAGGTGNGFCTVPQGETVFTPPTPPPEPNIFVSGIVNVNGENLAIVQTGENSSPKTLRQGDSFVAGNTPVVVKQIQIYNPGPNIILAGTPSPRAFSASGLAGQVVFQSQVHSSILREVGQRVNTNAENAEETDTATSNLNRSGANLTRDRFDIGQSELQGIKFLGIENVVKRTINIGTVEQPQPQEVVEISGYICNNTAQNISVSQLVFALSSEGIELPPLTAFFQGLEQGDIGNSSAGTRTQNRIIRSGRITLFRGTVANVPAFGRPSPIEMSLVEWN